MQSVMYLYVNNLLKVHHKVIVSKKKSTLNRFNKFLKSHFLEVHKLPHVYNACLCSVWTSYENTPQTIGVICGWDMSPSLFAKVDSVPNTYYKAVKKYNMQKAYNAK